MDLGFEILSTVSGTPVKEIYKLVVVHLTDSVGNNTILQEMYDLDKPEWRIFYGTHTTLGFAAALINMMKILEQLMKVKNIVTGFMVDMDADYKKGCIASQALYMIHKLVSPEEVYSKKQWNKAQQFKIYLSNKGISALIFEYKGLVV